MYESIMWSYIREEEQVLKELLKNPQVRQSAGKMGSMQAMYFIAHGSSYNAANAIAPLFGKLTKTRVYVYTPSQVIHGNIPLFLENTETTMVCAISQTGTSRGVLEALDLVKKNGFSVVGITDVVNAPVEQMADLAFHLNCHGEDSNAKTKGYSATLLILCKMAVEIGLSKGILANEMAEEIYEALAKEIDHISGTAQIVHDWCKEESYGVGMSHVYVIGNGINYATAMEGQLKLMETVCIPTMFSNIEEFSHGMHRSLKEDSFVIILDTEKGHELSEKTFTYLQEKNMNVLMLSTEIKEQKKGIICLQKYNNTDSVLLTTVAIQVISAFVPEINGTDPNCCANDDYTEYVETRV